jgi:hypothetical protein
LDGYVRDLKYKKEKQRNKQKLLWQKKTRYEKLLGTNKVNTCSAAKKKNRRKKYMYVYSHICFNDHQPLTHMPYAASLFLSLCSTLHTNTTCPKQPAVIQSLWVWLVQWVSAMS